ncbi:MAG: hypothetical protein ABIG36_10810 [Pseudomonadota bacterium]
MNQTTIAVNTAETGTNGQRTHLGIFATICSMVSIYFSKASLLVAGFQTHSEGETDGGKAEAGIVFGLESGTRYAMEVMDEHGRL